MNRRFLSAHPGPLPRAEGEPFSDGRSVQTARLFSARCSLFPLPAGEGQGEGSRGLALAADPSRNCRTHRVLRPEPEVCQNAIMNRFIIPFLLLSWIVSGPARAADKVDFAKQIQPLLQQNCVKCHGTEKQKGKLRLDSKEAAMKGGKDGLVIVAGEADKSEMYRRITLPKGNDDVMPNEGPHLHLAQNGSRATVE